MGEGYRIREAGYEDIDPVVELWSALLDYHRKFDPKYEKSADAEPGFALHLREYVASEDRLLLIVEVDGVVVGFANAFLAQYPPCLAHRAYGHLDNMMVAAECRRRGLGTALFHAAMEWFRTKGGPTVEARVHLANSVSKGFTQKVGLAPYMQLVRASTLSSE